MVFNRDKGAIGKVKKILPSIPFVFFVFCLLLYPVAQLVASVFLEPFSLSEISPSLWIVKITVLQAFVSAVLSGLAGGVGALVFSESRSRLARLPWILSPVCFSLPTLIVALSFSGFWGRNGWLGSLLNKLFEFEFYGWFAVLGAHVFLNQGIFLRTVGRTLKQMDRREEMAALSLGANRLLCFSRITLPKLFPSLKTSFLLSFAYCTSSFLIVLLLGGGIQFTTLEVAVYEALKIQFDLPKALLFSAIQLLLNFTFFSFLTRRVTIESRTESLFLPLYLRRALLLKGAYVCFYFLFILGPLIYLFVDGVLGWFVIDWEQAIPAMEKSVFLALSVAAVCILLSVGAAHTIRFHPARPFSRVLELLSLFPLFISSIVLSFGLMNTFAGALRGNLVGPLLVQVLLCLPFSVRILVDALREIPDHTVFAAQSLGANPWRRFVGVEFPLLRRAIASVFLLSLSFSLGEVGSFLIFSSEGVKTLPVLLFHWMGKYQFREASAMACLLVFLVMSASFFVERGDDFNA